MIRFLFLVLATCYFYSLAYALLDWKTDELTRGLFLELKQFNLSEIAFSELPSEFREVYGTRSGNNTLARRDPGGIEGVDYSQQLWAFSGLVRNSVGNTDTIIGFFAGPFTSQYLDCSWQGVSYQFTQCLRSLVYASARTVIAGAIYSNQGTYFAQMAYQTFIGRYFSGTDNMGQGNQGNGHDELRIRGIDNCNQYQSIYAYPSDYVTSQVTFKHTAANHCNTDTDINSEQLSNVLANYWTYYGSGAQMAYTYLSGTGSTKYVSIRGQIDIIPPFNNMNECPAEVSGDGLSCVCNSC